MLASSPTKTPIEKAIGDELALMEMSTQTQPFMGLDVITQAISSSREFVDPMATKENSPAVQGSVLPNVKRVLNPGEAVVVSSAPPSDDLSKPEDPSKLENRPKTPLTFD